MTRVPVHFALGSHGDKGSLIKQADRKFFRKSASAFFEQRVLTENRKVTVVFEGLPLDLSELPKTTEEREAIIKQRGNPRDNSLRKIQKRMDMFEKSVLDLLEKTFEIGMRIPRVSNLEIYAKGFDKWGITELILQLNSVEPGTVKCIIEPQDAEAVILGWNYSMLFNKGGEIDLNDPALLPLVVDYLKALAKFDLHRDRKLEEQIFRLSRSNPRRAFLILRGSAHSEAPTLFNERYFEITKDINPSELDGDFITHITRSTYLRTIQEAEYIHYAKLLIEDWKYGKDHLNSLKQILLRIIGLRRYAARLIHREAREHALSVIGEFHKGSE